MDKEKNSGLKLIHTMTEKEKEKFYKWQATTTIREQLKKSQCWKDTALQRVGDMVVW
jgi:hypothetical protein